MCGEGGGALEGFSAHLALKAFLLRVDIHVLFQTDSVTEGFSADVASKRSCSTVRPPDMDLQSVGCGEDLFTGDAVVGVGGGGIVGAAVQRLLSWWAAAQVVAVQISGVLQNLGAKTHLTELERGRHRLPGVRLVVRRESCHVSIVQVIRL